MTTTITISTKDLLRLGYYTIKSQNLLLQQAVAKLNSETESSSFIILDLYASFTPVFKNKADHLGSIKFKKPLKSCCVGQSDSDWCGRRYDMDGSPMYTVCERNSAFFWDDAHPSQQGWTAVYSNLQATLQQLY
ncbi:PREDICTED: GDSL esterase/lipase At5g03610-like [Fragaria vesca subsp. vesca]